MKKNSSSVNNTGISSVIQYTIFTSSDTDKTGFNAITQFNVLTGKDQKCAFSLSGEAYQNMIGALRSPETKSTYTFRLVALVLCEGRYAGGITSFRSKNN